MHERRFSRVVEDVNLALLFLLVVGPTPAATDRPHPQSGHLQEAFSTAQTDRCRHRPDLRARTGHPASVLD
jgi:hypothetical protein